MSIAITLEVETYKEDAGLPHRASEIVRIGYWSGVWVPGSRVSFQMSEAGSRPVLESGTADDRVGTAPANRGEY